jgi:hypothetical protein
MVGAPDLLALLLGCRGPKPRAMLIALLLGHHVAGVNRLLGNRLDRLLRLRELGGLSGLCRGGNDQGSQRSDG